MKAIVQLRGEVNITSRIRDTLKMLNLHHVNHCTLIPETDSYRGMIIKVHDYVAYGKPSLPVLEKIISRRAEPLEGDATIDDEWISKNTEYDSITHLTQAIISEETTLRSQGLSPVLRLHPPRGGHRGIKHPTKEGGQLGKHTTEEIDKLLNSMR